MSASFAMISYLASRCYPKQLHFRITVILSILLLSPMLTAVSADGTSFPSVPEALNTGLTTPASGGSHNNATSSNTSAPVSLVEVPTFFPTTASAASQGQTGLSMAASPAGAQTRSPLAASPSFAQTGGPLSNAPGDAPLNPSAVVPVSLAGTGLPPAASGSPAAASSPTAMVPVVPTGFPSGTGVPNTPAGAQEASPSPSAAVPVSLVPTGVPGTPASGAATSQNPSAAAPGSATRTSLLPLVPTGAFGTPVVGGQGSSAVASVAQTGVLPNSAAVSHAASMLPSAAMPGSMVPTGLASTAAAGGGTTHFSAPVSAMASQQMTTSFAPTGALTPANVIHIQLSGTMQGSLMQPLGGSSMTYSSLAPQLASYCGGIAPSRISNITLQQSPVGNSTILRFNILDGVPSNEVAAGLLGSLILFNNEQLTIGETGSTLVLSHQFVSWTDGGPCPSVPCSSGGGLCDASLTSGALACVCAANWGGAQCDVWTGPRPLLGLLVIPIVVGLLLIGLAVGFLIRWSRRRDGHKFPRIKPDMFKNVDSNYGSVSTVLEPGVRNKAYTTISSKSYAMPIEDAVIGYSSTDDKSTSSLF